LLGGSIGVSLDRRMRRVPSSACVLLIAVGLAAPAQAAKDDTLLVSSGLFGQEGTNSSFAPSMSGDGRYVAFESTAANLHPDDTDVIRDVFVRDLSTGGITLVSRANGGSGAKGNGTSRHGSISADGRYVAFESASTNLHPADIDGLADVFVRDLLTGAVTLASRASGAGGAKGGNGSNDPSISADGRHVVFSSFAANLHPDDTDANQDVYVRDLQAAATTLASRASGAAGAKGNDDSFGPRISADGQHVAFASGATNLHPDDGDGGTDVFSRGLQTSATTLVSRAAGAAGANGDATSFVSSVSMDGRYVAFESEAQNLHPDASDPSADAFVRDLATEALTLVSRASGPAGPAANNTAFGATLSSDGRYVAFESRASNLHPDDSDGTSDIYTRDLLTHMTALVSRASGAAGAKGNGDSFEATISADGRHVAFYSSASNLHEQDGDTLFDVFRRQLVDDPALPLGSPGPAGPSGPAGPVGPSGPEGREGPPAKLAVAMGQARLTARRGRRLVISYVSTLPARVTLEIRKGRRRIARVSRSAQAGRNRIAWNGRARRSSAAPGRYVVRLLARSADGQTASDRASLAIRGR
jgi:Tol biopolymer transport system component